MPISARTNDSGSELVIAIQGRFDFSAHQEFRNSYENIESNPSSYILDMNDTTYLDESALGLLLLLRDHAGGDSSSISIVNCNEDIKKILTISSFEQLFAIE
jgi:anti-anti-sigma factor